MSSLDAYPSESFIANVNFAVASICWLDNDRFLNVYGKRGEESDSITVLVTRQGDQYRFQKLAVEPTFPGMSPRAPPHYFISRIRKYEPNLNDTLVISSTISLDIGLLANPRSPLSKDAAGNVDAYALINMEEDSRKAAMPSTMSEDMTENDPIALGMAFDLSSNEPVKRPIPKEEGLEQTSMPLPALMVLNHEGALAAWWFINNPPILQNHTYQGMGMSTAQLTEQFAQRKQTNPVPATPSAPAFSQPGFTATPTPSMGMTQPSPWSAQQGGQKFAQPSFGAPSFGTPSAPAFGSPAPLGSAQTPFTGGTGTNAPVFGQNSSQGEGASKASPFSAFTKQSATSSSPFSNLNKNVETSLFGKTSSITENKTTTSFSALGQSRSNNWGFGEPDNKDDKPAMLAQQPSAGSTMTIGSSFGSFGAPSALGSNVSAWATPSLSNNTSDGVKAGTVKPQDEDADMDMDKKADNVFDTGMSSLGLGDQQQGKADSVVRSSTQEEPKNAAAKQEKSNLVESTKPVEATEPQKEPTPEAAPLSPDSSAQTPSAPTPAEQKPEIKSEEPPLPSEPSALPTLPTDEASKEVQATSRTPEKSSVEESHEAPRRASDGEEKEKAPTTPQSPKASPQEPTDPPSEEQPKAVKTPSKEEARGQELSPAGSEPEIVEAEKSIPASPTKSFTSDVDDTPGMDKARTWPRQKSPVQPTPTKPLFGEQTPSATYSFNDQLTQSTTPSTLQKPPVYFQPPDQSPRSPSPIRQQPPTGRRIASPTRRTGSGLSPNRSPTQSPAPTPDRALSSPGPMFTTTPRPQHQHRPSGLQHQITPAKSSPVPSQSTTPVPARAPSPTPSVDFSVAEDAENRVHEELEAPIKPSTKLKAFIASTDYVKDSTGTSVASQIERLFRDGNSMIDALGINARTLRAFVRGHEELYKEGERDVEDLEKQHHQGWTLDELDHLGLLQKQLADRLQANQPQDVKETLVELRDIHRDTMEMRTKVPDLARQFADIQCSVAGIEPTSKPTRTRGKLSPQQAAVLRDLRKQYANLQTLLSRAEDSSSLLRAKIVACEAHNGAHISREVPTYEAVINTIAKMTRMAEEKRSNVDVLEARLKKLKKMGAWKSTEGDDLGMSQLSLGSSTPRRSARYSTPPSTAKKTVRLDGSANKRTSPGYGFSYSDDSDDEGTGNGVVVKREGSEERDADLARSTRSLALGGGGGDGRGDRRRFTDLTDEQLETLAEREANRRAVLRIFRDCVVQRGVRVTDRSRG